MDRFKEPKDPVTVRHCSQCGGEIYEGDEVVSLENGDTWALVHDRCFDDYIESFFDITRGHIAADGGID